MSPSWKYEGGGQEISGGSRASVPFGPRTSLEGAKIEKKKKHTWNFGALTRSAALLV